jgi:hypothetical protein
MQERPAELQIPSEKRTVTKVVVEGRTGAPRSPQRTWAENGIFQMLSLNRQETLEVEKKQGLSRGIRHNRVRGLGAQLRHQQFSGPGIVFATPGIWPAIRAKR